jgi:hypothetical protein
MRVLKRKLVSGALSAKCAVVDVDNSDAPVLDRFMMPIHWPANMTQDQIKEIGALRKTIKDEKSSIYRCTVIKPAARGSAEKAALSKENVARTITRAWEFHDNLNSHAMIGAAKDIDEGLAMIAAGMAITKVGRDQLQRVELSDSTVQGGSRGAMSVDSSKLMKFKKPLFAAWAKEQGIIARSKIDLVAKIAEASLTTEALEVAAGIAITKAGVDQIQSVQLSVSTVQGGSRVAMSVDSSKLMKFKKPVLAAWAKERGIKARAKIDLVAKIAEACLTKEALEAVAQ